MIQSKPATPVLDRIGLDENNRPAPLQPSDDCKSYRGAAKCTAIRTVGSNERAQCQTIDEARDHAKTPARRSKQRNHFGSIDRETADRAHPHTAKPLCDLCASVVHFIVVHADAHGSWGARPVCCHRDDLVTRRTTLLPARRKSTDFVPTRVGMIDRCAAPASIRITTVSDEPTTQSAISSPGAIAGRFTA